MISPCAHPEGWIKVISPVEWGLVTFLSIIAKTEFLLRLCMATVAPNLNWFTWVICQMKGLFLLFHLVYSWWQLVKIWGQESHAKSDQKYIFCDVFMTWRFCLHLVAPSNGMVSLYQREVKCDTIPLVLNLHISREISLLFPQHKPMGNKKHRGMNDNVSYFSTMWVISVLLLSVRHVLNLEGFHKLVKIPWNSRQIHKIYFL